MIGFALVVPLVSCMVAKRVSGVTVVVMAAGCALVLGKTGVYARVLRAKARRSFLLYVAGVGGCVAVAVGSFLVGARGVPLVVVAAVFVLAAAVCWALAQKSRVRIAQLSAGIRAESITAARLEKLAVTAVVHDVLLSSGDVDHVVLGPVCVAVETKYGQGPVSVTGDRVHVGRKALRGNPLVQARRSADLVARTIRVPCLPMLVISGATGSPQLHAGVWITSPDHLPGIVDSLPHALDPVSAHAAACRLHELSEHRRLSSS